MINNWIGSNTIDAYNDVSSDAGDVVSFEILNKVIAEATTASGILPIQPSAGRPASGQLYPRYVPGA